MLTRLHALIGHRLAAVVFTASVSSLLAAEPPEQPKPAPAPAPVPTSPAPEAAKPAPDAPPPRGLGGGDLRALIGVNTGGLKRVEVPAKLPAMTLRGFLQPSGQPAIALLELAELKRIFVVQVGTEIPITIAGRAVAAGHGELTGLGGTKVEAPTVDPSGQTQIILKVLKVSNEGVTVEAGLLAQTIVIR